jgi:hypothetical protein
MADFSGVVGGAVANANAQKQKRPDGQFQQNLQGARDGTIQGANGRTQQLGAAAQRRLGAQGPNTAGGGTNPTPPTMDPAQKPPAWQALQQAGIGGQGSAAANRAAAAGLQPQVKPMALPGFMPMPGRMDTGNLMMDGNPISFPGGPPTGGPATTVDVQGHAPTFGSGAMQGVGDTVDQAQQHGGAPGGPLPGFTAAPGTMGATGDPLMSLPGPAGKFPPRPGLPTKPLPLPTPGTPQVRPGIGGGGLSPTGPRPRNNMASY